MKITIEIKNEKQQELVEKLRGEKPAEEFAALCFEAGLKLAVANLKQKAQGPLLKVATAKPEFTALDVTAITDALQKKDPANPVTIEVGRLVRSYTTQLQDYLKKNRGKGKQSLRISAQAPIEKVAFQITTKVVNQSIKPKLNGKKSA